MANIIDDLFQWAAQQPAGNIITVGIAITTNEITRNNLVSYAEGHLNYHPAHSTGWLLVLPFFASPNDGVTQYFSDRRYGGELGFGTAPFDSKNTDPLTVSITRPIIASGYTITIKSSKMGLHGKLHAQLRRRIERHLRQRGWWAGHYQPVQQEFTKAPRVDFDAINLAQKERESLYEKSKHNTYNDSAYTSLLCASDCLTCPDSKAGC
jgi:hypothetical protein